MQRPWDSSFLIYLRPIKELVWKLNEPGLGEVAEKSERRVGAGHEDGVRG